jgi:hypothetical protein
LPHPVAQSERAFPGNMRSALVSRRRQAYPDCIFLRYKTLDLLLVDLYRKEIRIEKTADDPELQGRHDEAGF